MFGFTKWALNWVFSVKPNFKCQSTLVHHLKKYFLSSFVFKGYFNSESSLLNPNNLQSAAEKRINSNTHNNPVIMTDSLSHWHIKRCNKL